MGFTHWMELADRTDDATVFVCPEPGCGRRVAVSKSEGIRVIDRGDFFATHVAAGGGGISLNAAVAAG